MYKRFYMLCYSPILCYSRLLVVHPQQTRSKTQTVAVPYPGTNAGNCSLTSSSDHTTIYPLGPQYSSSVQKLKQYILTMTLKCAKISFVFLYLQVRYRSSSCCLTKNKQRPQVQENWDLVCPTQLEEINKISAHADKDPEPLSVSARGEICHRRQG